MDTLAQTAFQQLSSSQPRLRFIRRGLWILTRDLQKYPKQWAVESFFRKLACLIKNLHPLNPQAALSQYLELSAAFYPGYDNNMAILQVLCIRKQQPTSLVISSNPPTQPFPNSDTTAAFPAQKTILIIDIEGPPSAPLEIAILRVVEMEIHEVFLQYGVPHRPAKPFNNAKFSHGLHHQALERHSQLSSIELLQAAKQYVTTYPEAEIISMDIDPRSDVNTLLKQWGTPNSYKNIFLGTWRERVHNPSHLQARQDKFTEQPIKSVACAYNTLHVVPLSYKLNHDNLTQRLKAQHKSNCALYDSYELYLHLRDNPSQL
jgi:hypothetical protein